MKEVLYHDDYLLLEYVADGNYLHETWMGLTPSYKFLILLDIVISNLYKKEVDGLLLNASEHKGITKADRDKASELHEAYAEEHGSLKQAIIVPKDLFSSFSVKDYGRSFDKNNLSKVRYFANISSAQKWLKQA